MVSILGIPLVGTSFPITIIIFFFIGLFLLSRKFGTSKLSITGQLNTQKEQVITDIAVKEDEPQELKLQSKAKKKKICGKKGGVCCSNKSKKSKCKNVKETIKMVKIYYATVTGNAKMFATNLFKRWDNEKVTVKIIDLAMFDPEHLLSEDCSGKVLSIFILPTHSEGKPPETGTWFFQWLEESVTDFRLQKGMLKDMKYAVFGLGNSQYAEHYNVVGKKVDKWLHKLQAERIIRLGLGNEDTSNNHSWSIQEDFQQWSTTLLERLNKWLDTNNEHGGNCNIGDSNDEVEKESSCDSSIDSDDGGNSESEDSVVDLEELGPIMKKQKLPVSEELNSKIYNGDVEMITPLLRSSLTKQGYRLVGSHSGVKLCRWTKSMLRGRGGCYKHSFYGIESHRCMETTPSLACANKCVFCWRHHSNPVGTEWRWKMDPPDMILTDALEQHYKMINQFRGVPGVLPERLSEGFNAKHCALSLVGEPIMYPEINTFVRLLHKKGISSFLVTNAQFPEAMRNLVPVTQLYVSVDAASKESLKKIDRPLFKDFWERFQDSLVALSEKGQRTVYRLTLVKAWNTDEIDNYAKLVSLGKPDFIEVKGVTYCGTSKASNLTMENVPWHAEVISFVQELANKLVEYEIASEHEHSNCILMAHKKFKVGEDWWTWIDYEKFNLLVSKFEESGGDETFTALDYMARTPSWAVYGSEERGFDPVETRWHRKTTKKDITGC